ncbi:hypothetical protein [Deinococcus sp.]|uniref:hypothetical protein n=1 Tax=Deinococcus sp. TaxID=47478 RepID=UPI003CC67FBC
MNRRSLFVLAVLTCAATASARSDLTVLARAPLLDLEGATVGQVTLERQAGRSFLHVRDAGKAAGATLELLLSASRSPLKAGDHGGPGPSFVRAGLFNRSEVRYTLPDALDLTRFQTVWVWCPAVKLPAARALLVSGPSGR